MQSWNIFTNHFNDIRAMSKLELKNKINSLLRPGSKNIYGVHDPLGIRYLFQLRLSLSPLNSHKWQHNFEDTSKMCDCNLGIEDTSHFLFSCPRYTIQRATLAANVINVLQKYNLSHLGNEPRVYLY